MNVKLALVAASAALAACGGGGGGDGSVDAQVPQFVARDYAFVPTFTSSPVGVAVFAIDPSTGAPSAVAGSPFAAGAGTVDVAVDPTCRFVYAANVLSGNISAYSIDGMTGALVPVAGSPFSTNGTGAQSLTVHPSGKFLYVAGTVALRAYAINSTSGVLTDLGSQGPGASSIAVDPSGRFAYAGTNGGVLGQMHIPIYSIDTTTGALTSAGSGPVGNGANFIAIDPAGNFLYATTSIFGLASYSINANSGALTAVGPDISNVGTSGTIAIDPTSKFLYLGNSAGSSISAFSIGASGALTSLGPVQAENGAKSVAIDSTGKFAYTAHTQTGTMSRFAINSTTGGLTSLGPSVPVPAGAAQFSSPQAVKIVHRAAP